MELILWRGRSGDWKRKRELRRRVPRAVGNIFCVFFFFFAFYYYLLYFPGALEKGDTYGGGECWWGGGGAVRLRYI